MKVIGYSRYTLDDDGPGALPIAEQDKRIREYCKARELQLVRIESDHWAPGHTLKRPGIMRAFTALERCEADGLIVVKLDRLTDRADTLKELLRTEFNEHRRLMSILDAIDTGTPSGRLLLDVLDSVDALGKEILPATN